MTDTGGLILNIQRMSTEDGPGLRTTVFFKGCPLSCRWCHNPESLSFIKQLEWFDDRCMGCESCVSVCHADAISFIEEKLVVDYAACTLCMKCCSECPANALEAKGSYWTVTDLVDELAKDKSYFSDNGGVTLSGGEAMAQPGFTLETVNELKNRNINTAIDTCGLVNFETIDSIFPFTDIFLYDIKLIDSKKHKELTGQGNEIILENLKKLADLIREDPQKLLWIRTPLIPGATDSMENISSIRDFINDNIADVTTRWELCSFNNLCSAKYRRLGRVFNYEGVKKQSADELEKIEKAARQNSTIAERTYITGGARIE